jgi:hypothetical protein
MIDVLFNSSLTCGINGLTCVQAAQAGIVIENRLNGDSWLRPVCLQCLSSITPQSCYVPVVTTEIQVPFMRLALLPTLPLSCPGVANYRARSVSASMVSERPSFSNPCGGFAIIAAVRQATDGLWEFFAACPSCAHAMGVDQLREVSLAGESL